MHWWQGAFTSSSKSQAEDDSVINRRTEAVGSSYSSTTGIFSSRRNPNLQRSRKLRHVTERDVELWRSSNQCGHSSVRSSPDSTSVSALASPQPLPLPELQALLQRDSKFSKSSCRSVALPSPYYKVQIPRRGWGEKLRRRDGEGETIDDLNADDIDALIGLNSKLGGQAKKTRADGFVIRPSRKSPLKNNDRKRSPSNYSLTISSTPNSAPASPCSSPTLSPRISDTSQYITSPGQVWSAPEMPHSDRNVTAGFYQFHTEKSASSAENSSLQSLSGRNNVRDTSPSGPVSPLNARISPETPSLRQERESNSQSSSHPLPLPPCSSSSQPTPTSPFISKSDFSGSSVAKLEYSGSNIPVLQSPISSVPEFVPVKSQWQKGKLIGRGTFGSVYVASNRETGALCAMKEVELLPDDSKSAESLKQLQQEIKVLSQLKHLNIVQYYGSEIVGDKFYIYLEYVHPGSISRFIQDHCGAMTESVVRNFTRHILCGLAYLHSKRTIHRDIKGANLLVDAHGVVKLADFGMAKHLNGQAANLSLKGSPYWLAPELLQSVAQTDASSDIALVVDIWSLGCTIIEMMNGKPPWSEYEGAAALFKVLQETPPIPEALSADGKDFLQKCFRRNPAERPTASELLEHPFVNNSQQQQRDAFTQSLKGIKLTGDIRFQRDRSTHKFVQVPSSFNSQINKGKLANSEIFQRIHHQTPHLAAVPFPSPRSTLEGLPALSPPSSGRYSDSPGAPTILPSPIKMHADTCNH